MNQNSIAIRCRGLSRRYGDVDALKPLDLEVPTGSIFGFLGRNGAGKTTTMRLMSGLALPTAGQAWIAGVETTQPDSQARWQFGYLPQDPAFYNWMNATQYLDYIAQLYLMSTGERRQRVAEMLTLVALDKDAKRPIGGFSGGMKQRLGIAQALLHQPPVLLLDEPTSALDPAGRYEILKLIDTLRGQVTVFLSSHILADVERVCDTIGVIHLGELLLVKERDALMAEYETNVMALEVDPGNSSERVTAFTAQLEAEAWVTGVTAVENGLHISVNNIDQSRQALWPLVVKHALVINKFEWQRASLEEIFLSLSSTPE